MATQNKITVRVTPSSKKQTISVRTTGTWGGVQLGGMNIDLPGQTLTVPTSDTQYWTAILTAVLAAIPEI
jgi:hypothetical protein